MQCDRKSQDFVLVLRLTCCVTLNKSLPFSGFQGFFLLLLY